jgi:hypothetical protein
MLSGLWTATTRLPPPAAGAETLGRRPSRRPGRASRGFWNTYCKVDKSNTLWLVEHREGSGAMALDPAIKKAWIEIQRNHAVPVNAIGVPIPAKDEGTLKVWRQEGIDQYMRRQVRE